MRTVLMQKFVAIDPLAYCRSIQVVRTTVGMRIPAWSPTGRLDLILNGVEQVEIRQLQFGGQRG